jgi:hypothetical protein
MIVVLRAYGLKIIIFVDDHDPPHVHVRGDGQAKINLIGRNGLPELVWSAGMNSAEKRRALKAVHEAQVELLEHWRQIHGSEG